MVLLTLRPIGLAFIVGMVAYIVNPSSMRWASFDLPSWLRWAGVGVAVLGEGLLFWALRTLGRNLTDTVVTRREHDLVMDGPYGWVRHPFYIAVGLWMLAVFLITANGFLLLTGTLVLALLAIRTPIEERFLIERFGEEYRSYMRRTGRFLPRGKRVS